MSRFALDLRMLVEPPDGISRYALELLRRLPPLLPGHELLALGRPEPIRRHVPEARVVTAQTTSISLKEQLELPWLLRNERVDLFHASLFVAPLLGGCRYLLTLHDVNYLVLPHLYGRHRQTYFQTAVRLFARRAEAVLTVSEFSKREIVRLLGVAPERIEVVPNGVDPRFHPVAPEEVAALRERLRLPSEYLLYVGSFVPHKNVPALLRAYRLVPDAPPLVLCGRNPETIAPTIERLGLQGRVHTVPGVGDDALPALYTGATAFVFPSRYEGFGLPPMEAMACGTPTVVSDAGSLPEVTNGAALTFPVDDEQALAARLREVLGSAGRRAELARAGRARAAEFSWDACAERLAGSYLRHLG